MESGITMSIYDLNNIFFLQHDIESILNKIDQLYKVDFQKNRTTFQPKTIVDKKHHWTSELCDNAFNNLIPLVKSLHKDMYAVLETIFKSKKGSFDKPFLEKKYTLMKEFRLLNNKFKHYNNREADINLTKIVFPEPQGQRVDVFCNFKYENNLEGAMYYKFIETFLQILKDEKIIQY